MKKLLFAAVTLLFTLQIGTAQKTFKKALSNVSGKQKIEFTIENANLEIVGYNGSEVAIEADDDYEGPPERAKGLKPLYNKATDNTGIGLDVQEAGGVMTIRQASHQDASYKIKVPAGASISIEETGWNSTEISIEGTSGEIEFNGNGSGIQMKNVTGPVVAQSTNGNIEIVFSRLNTEKPTDINATNGHIDITLPADTKANVELKSINGEAYSDFDIKMPENERSKGMRSWGKRNVEGTINGGGVELSLNTINDNIYLRKK